MKEQIGLLAMIKKINANLPFWSEKLPEIPDLIYDSLRQVKQLPALQQKHFEQQQLQQQKFHKNLFYTLAGATVLIIASILPLYFNSHLYSGVLVALGLAAWIKAWIKR